MIRSADKTAEFFLVLVSLLAAAGWLFSRESLHAMTPFFFLGCRFIAAALVVMVLDLDAFTGLSRAQIRRALVAGSVLGLQTLLWVLGLFHAENMGVGAFLVSLGFLLTPVLGALLFRVSTYPHTWVALLVATLGLGFLSLNRGLDLSLSDSLFLACAVVYAFYFNFNSRYSAQIPAIPLTVLQLAAAGAVTLAASLAVEPAPTADVFSVLGWFVASVLIATSLRFYLLVRAQATAPVAHGAVIMTLEPVWTALLGALWFGELMSSMQLLGCVLIFAALVINAVGNSLRQRRLLTALAAH